MLVKLTHPITWETAFLDDDLPPLLRRSVESSKQIVQIRGQGGSMGDFIFLSS